MKKILIDFILFIFGIIFGITIAFNNIKVDYVNELDHGTITLEIFGHYFDYYYERGE